MAKQKFQVAKLSDLPDGQMQLFQISGREILVVRVGTEVFAANDQCTHEKCSLSNEGFLDGNVITCGCHGARFDLSSGQVLSLPAVMNLPSYQVEIDNGIVFVYI